MAAVVALKVCNFGFRAKRLTPTHSLPFFNAVEMDLSDSHPIHLNSNRENTLSAYNDCQIVQLVENSNQIQCRIY